jgi:hypothetical protein
MITTTLAHRQPPFGASKKLRGKVPGSKLQVFKVSSLQDFKSSKSRALKVSASRLLEILKS